MKKIILPLLIVICISVAGCKVFTNKGKVAAAESKSRVAIAVVEDNLNKNTAKKLEEVSAFAYGTDISLRKLNDPPKEVVVALDMNQRVLSLSGNPTLEVMKQMQSMINGLLSTIESERAQGKIKLQNKDKEIKNIQVEESALLILKDVKIKDYMSKAENAAASADGYKSELSEWEGWFGLKGVMKGGWKFIKSSMWFIGIGSILFLILRIASMSNPIAAGVFSIFNMIGSWFVHIIQIIVPKAVSIAGNTATSVFNAYKSTMSKLVDGIQIVKDRAAAQGKTPDLNDVLDEVAKTMNADEKQIIDELKKALNWKQ